MWIIGSGGPVELDVCAGLEWVSQYEATAAALSGLSAPCLGTLTK